MTMTKAIRPRCDCNLIKACVRTRASTGPPPRAHPAMHHIVPRARRSRQCSGSLRLDGALTPRRPPFTGTMPVFQSGDPTRATVAPGQNRDREPAFRPRPDDSVGRSERHLAARLGGAVLLAALCRSARGTAAQGARIARPDLRQVRPDAVHPARPAAAGPRRRTRPAAGPGAALPHRAGRRGARRVLQTTGGRGLRPVRTHAGGLGLGRSGAFRPVA